MPVKAVKLTVQRDKRTGHVRYRKYYRKRLFQSRTFDGESRRNESEARQAFREFARDVDRDVDAEATTIAAAGCRQPTILQQIQQDIADRFEPMLEVARRTNNEELYRTVLASIEELKADLDGKLTMEYYGDRGKALVQSQAAYRAVLADLPKPEKSDFPTAEEAVEVYLDRIAAKVKSGERSANHLGSVRPALNRFLDYFGRTTSIEHLTEDTVAGYSTYLRSLDISPSSAAGYLKRWRTFVRRTCENLRRPVPTNLDSSEHRIEPQPAEIETFTPEEVAILLGMSSDRMSLYILLMLNCGMTQQELSDLKGSHVDWDRGRILWSRSKTKKSNPPTINYPLWDETWRLLQSLGHRKGSLLRKEDGTDLIIHGVRDALTGSGQTHTKKDAVRSLWRHLVRRCRRDHFGSKWSKSLKHFRKTAASMLEASDHAEFVDMHLDHKRVARNHYIKKGQIVPRFDEAVVWLGEQFELRTDQDRITADRTAKAASTAADS